MSHGLLRSYRRQQVIRSEAARDARSRDMTLQIEKGEFVAIVGFSGSGKTTLISILAGLLAPDRARSRWTVVG